MSPLASGDYADVACSSVLDGTGQTSDALSSGLTGETQQKLTPIAPVLCGLAGSIAAAATANECKKWRGPDSEFCGVGGFINNISWLGACTLMF